MPSRLPPRSLGVESSPREPAREQTEKPCEEANAAGGGSISVDGNMVDAVSIKMARNTLDLARGAGEV